MDFSEETIDEILKIFQVESEEIISRLNNNLLDLEKNPNNKDAILMLFRDAHSLKGASRMVGFNNVQTLAHKMEDVLGLAKESQLVLNSVVVNILYKTVDFLSELIQKSIQKGQEIYSEDISQHILSLDKVGEYSQELPSPSEQNDFNQELFLQNTNKINSLIPECLFLLMQIEIHKNGNLIGNLLSAITELYKLFETLNIYETKKWIEDIKVKLEFISKASNSLTVEETGDIQSILDRVINKMASLYELYNVEIVDYYSIAFEKTMPQEQKEEVLPQEPIFKEKEEVTHQEAFADRKEIFFLEDVNDLEFVKNRPDAIKDTGLDFIKNKVADIINSGSSITEIKDLITDFEKNCRNEDIKNILQKIAGILEFSVKNEIQINEDTISVLIQSIEFCDNTLKNMGDISDKELIFQRLEITQQILEFNKEKTEVEVFINPKEEKIKKITDFSEVFNTGSIKTLRVDSNKLDSLVNQMNELSVNKIKTKKHLQELNEIGKEVEEWQKNLGKIINYLKYYDKKNAQTEFAENSNTFLTKQLIGLFTESNKKVQKISSNMTSLQRTVQEDDAKTHFAVNNLNNMIKSIRVLPLATVFHLFGRMVRDIAQEKNKKIDFEILGSETSTDKKIIEEIKTPLIHIIRNAIDHGIETPDERVALGKSPVGKILLSARQSNNKVIIEIIDDGRGINIAKLREKAVQKGFLTEEELNSMSDEQITNIIFAPGFSTGDEITNISGRGIGLDVVQSKISQLNGNVKVISETNKGCCVQIELPTTMSIINAFLVQSANQTFAIPIETINTVLRKKIDDIIFSNNKRSIIFKDETISLYDLADVLKLEKTFPDRNKITILILESNNKKMALCVDKIIGEEEILHKKLSAPFYKLKNISGLTTLISGEVCLILNISNIIKSTSSSKTPTCFVTKKPELDNSNFKILLVDDSATTRTLEKNILKTAGYNIETAENPIEAFEKMKNIRFDLIISDVEMPEMDGFEFLEKIKTDEMYSDIPVIMLSSLASEQNTQRAAELGAEKYIIKGQFNQDELQESISKILGQR